MQVIAPKKRSWKQQKEIQLLYKHSLGRWESRCKFYKEQWQRLVRNLRDCEWKYCLLLGEYFVALLNNVHWLPSHHLSRSPTWGDVLEHWAHSLPGGDPEAWQAEKLNLLLRGEITAGSCGGAAHLFSWWLWLCLRWHAPKGKFGVCTVWPDQLRRQVFFGDIVIGPNLHFRRGNVNHSIQIKKTKQKQTGLCSEISNRNLVLWKLITYQSIFNSLKYSQKQPTWSPSSCS